MMEAKTPDWSKDTPGLIAFLKKIIIESLKLEDLDPEEIKAAVLPSETASLTFLFEIHRPSDQTLIVQGETTHVLQDKEGKMIYKFSGALREKTEAMVAYCNSPG
jgi:hypothetical protein